MTFYTMPLLIYTVFRNNYRKGLGSCMTINEKMNIFCFSIVQFAKEFEILGNKMK